MFSLGIRYTALMFAVIALPLSVVAQDVPADSDAATEEAQTPEEPTGRLIEGIVLSHYGNGVVGAKVRVESIDTSRDAPPIVETTTDEYGNISVHLPLDASELEAVRIRIVTESHADWVTELDLTDEYEEPFIDATLEGVNKLSGQVVTADDIKPIDGAVITCDNAGRQLFQRSDKDGRFAFDTLFSGKSVITVNAEGFALRKQLVNVDEDEIDMMIALELERVIELRVITNEGDPADNLTIEVNAEPMQQYLTAVTDKKGMATLHGLSAETTKLAARLNGERYVQMKYFEQTITLASPEEPTSRPSSQPTTQTSRDENAPLRKTVVVTVAAGIKGTVVDAETGVPIVGVRVIAGREQRYDMPMTWTSVDGSYELIGLQPGLNVITFQPNTHAPTVEERLLMTGKIDTINVKLSQGKPINGIVVDADGAPIGEVRVTAEKWKGHKTLGIMTITDADGRFAFDHVPDQGDIVFSFVDPNRGISVERKLTPGTTEWRIVLEESDQPTQDGLDIPAQIANGEPVPNLKMTAADGTVYQLSELRGQYVFIDCWASWCAPCIAEIPNIKQLREQTRDRADFIMIGVSLDRKRADFKEVVEAVEIDWPQIVGPKSGAEEVFSTLEGMTIPYSCLIGPDGKMIAQHLQGPQLADEVLKHLPAELKQ